MPIQMFFRLPLKGTTAANAAAEEDLSLEHQAAALAALFRKDKEAKDAKEKEVRLWYFCGLVE